MARSRWTGALIAFSVIQWWLNTWWVSVVAAVVMLLLLAGLHHFVSRGSLRSRSEGSELPWVTAFYAAIWIKVLVTAGSDRFVWALVTTAIMVVFAAVEIADWRDHRSSELREPPVGDTVG